MKLILENGQPIQYKTMWVGNSQEDRHIVLLANDLNFIQEALASIKNYAAKIDLNQSRNLPEIRPIQDFLYESKIDANLKYFVEIDHVLPRIVKIFYSVNLVRANCHGSAMVVAGMTVMPSCIYNEISFNESKESIVKIPSENLQCGDYIYMQSGDHSFVFLNDQICLSTNGVGNKLKIYPISSVLKKYGYPEKSLINEGARIGKIIKVFRKSIEEDNYPKYYNILTNCLEKMFAIYRDFKENEVLTLQKHGYFEMCMDNYYPGFPLDEASKSAYKAIAKELNICILEAQSDLGLSKAHLIEIENMYEACIVKMHPDILELEMIKPKNREPFSFFTPKLNLKSKKNKVKNDRYSFQKIEKSQQSQSPCIQMCMVAATISSLAVLLSYGLSL